MRKLYLEPEQPPEVIDVEHFVDPAWWESLLRMIGLNIEPRVEIRKEKRAAPRRWRWQTHAEIEEESGVVRHEYFFEDETYSG